MSGGCPLAATEIAQLQRIPEYVIEMIREWICGEIVLTGRNRASLMNLLSTLFVFGGTPVGQAKLAQEANLANNSIAADYIETLADLMCVRLSFALDMSTNRPRLKKAAKYHFVNLLAAIAWSPNHIRMVDDFDTLPSPEKGKWIEWVVAQELWRRDTITDVGEDPIYHWLSKNSEIDFVFNGHRFIEVKSGFSSPNEFLWFTKVFPGSHLTVISSQRFETSFCRGITLEDFLREQDW